MSLTLSSWELITLLGLVLSTCVAFARFFMSQMERRLDTRFIALEEARHQSQQQWLAQFEALGDSQTRTEQRTMSLLSELPLQYQRREDAIRHETAVIARIDALGEKLHRALECDVRHCPVKEVLDERR